jgi:hypothetical protein
MSIWNKCEKYQAYPFYGFPIKMQIIAGTLNVIFPEGYTPNGNKILEVKNKFSYLLGDIIEETENSFKIKFDDNKLEDFIYHAQFKFNYDEEKEKKISIGSWEW